MHAKVTERSISRHLVRLQDLGLVKAITKKGPYELTKNSMEDPNYMIETFFNHVRSKVFPKMQLYEFILGQNSDEFSKYVYQLSNTIGAYITYLLIQALNPKSAFLGNIRKQARENILSDWVSRGISITDFLHQFTLQLPREVTNLQEILNSRFDLDDQTIQKIIHGYKSAYPSLYVDFQDCLDSTKNEISETLKVNKKGK